jgi:hypothetical protein
MARIFLLGIAFYLVYRLVFDLIIPVYKTTVHVKRQFSNMRDQMNGQTNGASTQQQNTASASHSSKAKAKSGDYIDFEELK